MSTTSRVAGAVAAGYVLGRFKKLRLAVLVGSAMASPKFRNAAAGMIENRIPGGAITTTLSKEVGGRLVNVGKTAATSIVASRIDSLSQSLADRSQNLRKPGGQADKSRGDEEEGEETQEPEDEYEEEEGEETQEPEDEYEEEEEGEETQEPEEEGEETQEPEDEYDEQEADETQEPEDEYDEQEADETQEPEDEYDEEEADETQEQDAQASDDASADEEPEEPVARSPRRRRSASPAGRRRG